MSSDQVDIDEDALKRANNDNQVLAIVTIDVAVAFHSEMTGLLERMKEIITKDPNFVNHSKMACQHITHRFIQMIAALLLRLKAGRDASTPLNPFVGRMHFECPEGGPLILATIYEFASYSKSPNLGWLRTTTIVGLLHELQQTIDTYPLHRVIVPSVIPGIDLHRSNPSAPSDLAAHEYKEWWYRMCRGIRTPEDLPWAPTCEEIGHTIFIDGLATITTKSMLDEFYARAEDLSPLPFPISGFPKLQVYAYDHCKNDNVANMESPTPPPRLQHTIHRSELPDVLLVSDSDEVTIYEPSDDSDNESASGNEEKKPDNPGPVGEISYRRINPLGLGVAFAHPPPSSGPTRAARLHLTKTSRLGVGHSAQVYSATIQLNAPDSIGFDTDDRSGSLPCDSSEKCPAGSEIPEIFTVAAKIPFSSSLGLKFVLDEACIYEAFPGYLSESYDGFYMVPKDITGTPAVPVVPKSYGYYIADGVDNLGRRHNPILLIEECGAPIAESSSSCAALPRSDRILLHSMVRRLHRAGFSQGSFSPRNILVQPGPLHVPPAQRTTDQPSYRIIDFGRGVNQRIHFANKHNLSAQDIQMHAVGERVQAANLFDLDLSIYNT